MGIFSARYRSCGRSVMVGGVGFSSGLIFASHLHFFGSGIFYLRVRCGLRDLSGMLQVELWFLLQINTRYEEASPRRADARLRLSACP